MMNEIELRIPFGDGRVVNVTETEAKELMYKLKDLYDKKRELYYIPYSPPATVPWPNYDYNWYTSPNSLGDFKL